MSKLTEVTKKDIADAALIAQLIGVADYTGQSLHCDEIPSRKLHDCPNCEHIEEGQYCNHHEDWDCVASMIGATIYAVHLWLAFSNAVQTTREDRACDLRYLKKKGTKRELKEHTGLYAWVDSIREGGIHRRASGLNDLEVAALLSEGHLPPEWKLVARHRPTRALRKPKDIDLKLPMVLVRMGSWGPIAEAPPTKKETSAL